MAHLVAHARRVLAHVVGQPLRLMQVQLLWHPAAAGGRGAQGTARLVSRSATHTIPAPGKGHGRWDPGRSRRAGHVVVAAAGGRPPPRPGCPRPAPPRARTSSCSSRRCVALAVSTCRAGKGWRGRRQARLLPAPSEPPLNRWPAAAALPPLLPAPTGVPAHLEHQVGHLPVVRGLLKVLVVVAVVVAAVRPAERRARRQGRGRRGVGASVVMVC